MHIDPSNKKMWFGDIKKGPEVTRSRQKRGKQLRGPVSQPLNMA